MATTTTNTPIPENYKPIRDILTGMGFSASDVGYDAATKNPLLQGYQLPNQNYILGADQHYYADPNQVQTDVSAWGLKPPPPRHMKAHIQRT